MWLGSTHHCPDATRDSICKLRMRKGPHQPAAAAGPATEFIPVASSLLGRGGEFVLNHAFSKKHGFPAQEMGGFLNSVA